MPQSKKKPLIDAATPELVIETLAIGDLVPDPNNARSHSKKQVERIAGSISEFGFTNPPLIDENNSIIAGHARVEAARLAGLAHVPCVRLKGLTAAKKKALAIADNKLHDMSVFDPDKLLATLAELDALEYDIGFTGFDTAELDVLQEVSNALAAAAADPADEMPAPDLPAVTRIGDLWLLGKHRLLCGNSLEGVSYEALLASELADMIFSDMPYNVPIQGRVSGLGKARHREFAFASGEQSSAEFTTFMTDAMTLMARNSTDGSIHYHCMDWRSLSEMMEAGRAAYTELKNVVVWDKQTAGMGSLYRSQHELVFVFKSGALSEEMHRLVSGAG